MTPLLAHYPIPKAIVELILGSIGGALAVADKVGGALGLGLAAAARASFVSGMDLAFTVGAVVVGVAAVVVLFVLPNRAPEPEPDPAPPAAPAHEPADVGSRRI